MGKDLKNFKGSKGLKDNKGRKGRRKGRDKRAQASGQRITKGGGRQNEPACNAGLAFQFGVEGGDDETAEGGVVTGRRRGAVVLAVGGISALPIGLLCGIFEDG